MYILRNEKYVGEMRLQKTFVSDHLTKQKKRNKGELVDYYVVNSHEPIVERELFDQIQTILDDRIDKYHSHAAKPELNPFTSIIECGVCGAHYQRKISNSGTIYASPVWVCSTKKRHGKHACSGTQIAEQTLYNAASVVSGIKRILVTAPFEFNMELTNGNVVKHAWVAHSRKDSWNSDSREKARERAKKRYHHE